MPKERGRKRGGKGRGAEIPCDEEHSIDHAKTLKAEVRNMKGVEDCNIPKCVP